MRRERRPGKACLLTTRPRPPRALDCRKTLSSSASPLPLSISSRGSTYSSSVPLGISGDDEREREGERSDRTGAVRPAEGDPQRGECCPYLKKKQFSPSKSSAGSFRVQTCARRTASVSTERKSVERGWGGRALLTGLDVRVGAAGQYAYSGHQERGTGFTWSRKEEEEIKKWIGLKSKSGRVEREEVVE